MSTTKDQPQRIAGVFSYRGDGLGARLMAMGNGIRLARHFNCRFDFIWGTGSGIADIAKPSRLFDVAAMARLGLHFSNFPDAFSRDADPRLIFAPGPGKTIDLSSVPAGSFMLVTGHRAQRMEGEGLTVARKGLSMALSMVAPAAHLNERFLAFAGQHDLASAIGVHVRRGDITTPDYAQRDIRMVGLEHYFTILDINRNGDERIFLCTEDRSVIDAFEARYPGQVICHPTRTWARDDPRGVEDALIEIMALSRTSFVIAGPSSFSRAATGLGFNPLLTIYNADSGDDRNLATAADELIKFGMLDRAARNLAACASEQQVVAEARKRLDSALLRSRPPVSNGLPG